MARGKKVEDVMAADLKDADALLAAADAIAPMDDAMVKAAPAATVKGDIDKLKTDAMRGKIKMRIAEGTMEVRPVNAKDTTINTGGKANHSNQVTLKIDLGKVK